MRGELIVRADATAATGTGHVMRCLALALAWRTGDGIVTFLLGGDAPALHRRVTAAGFHVVRVPASHSDPRDLATTEAHIRDRNPEAVVLDGYHFDTGYQQSIQGVSRRLLVIDDYAHLPFYDADLLLNQNLYAHELSYRCPLTTVKLLGTEYVLLRPEFHGYQRRERPIAEHATRILVSLGGSDPANVSETIVRGLLQLPPAIRARVVVGPENPHAPRLQALAGAGGTIEIVQNVSDMPALMDWAELAIAAGGTTVWELAFIGVPMLLIPIADNQLLIVKAAAAAGFAANLGWYESINPDQVAPAVSSLLADATSRGQMAARGRTAVDGRGAERVVRVLRAPIVAGNA